MGENVPVRSVIVDKSKGIQTIMSLKIGRDDDVGQKYRVEVHGTGVVYIGTLTQGPCVAQRPETFEGWAALVGLLNMTGTAFNVPLAQAHYMHWELV